MASLPEDTINQVISETDIILLKDQALGRGAYGRVFKAKYISWVAMCCERDSLPTD